jgi:general secretion pathway protein M
MSRIDALASALTDRAAATGAGRWYAAQSPRDRRVLRLLGAFLAVVAVWLLLWVPVQDARRIAERRHADALADRAWMLEHRDEARRAGSGGSDGARSGQALLSTVAGSARRSGLTLNRFQPEGDDALSVFLDEVAFGELVLWLDALRREEGIRVRQASVDASGRSGRVRARLVLH